MNTLATSLLFACVGVVLAWLLRSPARRLAGASPAFCVWLLPPLLAAVAWLPAWHASLPSVPSMLVLPPLVVEPHAVGTAATSVIDTAQLLLALWLAGCAVMLARLAWHCIRIIRHSQPLPPPLQTAIRPHLAGLKETAVRVHPAGPAVCWLPRCHLLLPPDLLQRFDANDLAQVLAHERMHLARHDPLWSLLAELTLAALWFFPPAWLAINRFRLDQELACDAAIVGSTPGRAGNYARALLTGATGPHILTATTPWVTRSQLKERLTMIQHQPHTLLKRRSGYAALAAVLACTALAAHAALPGAVTPATLSSAVTPPPPILVLVASNTPPAGTASQAASVNASYRRSHPPHYPAPAIKNHEQGIVLLKVLVGTDGKPLDMRVLPHTHASENLIIAAKAAVREWRFHPARKNGKAIRSWARIPVTFKLPTRAQKESPVVILLPANAQS